MQQETWTKEQLVILAQDAGYTVTERQIERWHKADILPRPKRVHLGKAKGTTSEYPEGTGQQLLAVCRLHTKEKRLHYVCLALWQEGYSFPLSILKKSLDAMALAPLRKLSRGDGDELDNAEVAAKKAIPSLSKSKSGRRLRGHLRSQKELETTLIVIFQLLLGGQPEFEESHYVKPTLESTRTEIFIRNLDLRKAQTDRIGKIGPWLSGDVGIDLNKMSESRWLSVTELTYILQQATMEDIEQACADFDTLFVRLPQIMRLMEAFYGKGAFGLSMFIQSSVPEMPIVAFCLLVMLQARKLGFAEALNTLTQTTIEFFNQLQQ